MAVYVEYLLCVLDLSGCFVVLQLHVLTLQVKQSAPEVVELLDAGTTNSTISSADFTNRNGECFVYIMSFTYFSNNSHLPLRAFVKCTSRNVAHS